MKIRIRYILDIIAMALAIWALAIWALMAMMPSEAKTAAEAPTVLDIQAREAEAKAAADYESPEYEPTQGDAEAAR